MTLHVRLYVLSERYNLWQLFTFVTDDEGNKVFKKFKTFQMDRCFEDGELPEVLKDLDKILEKAKKKGWRIDSNSIS